MQLSRNENHITHTFSFTNYMYLDKRELKFWPLIAIYNLIFSIFLIIFQGKKAQGWYGTCISHRLVEVIYMCESLPEYSNYQIYMPDNSRGFELRCSSSL